MQKNEAWAPQWTRDVQGHAALRFDGADDCAILPSRSMPYGPFTLELNVFPERIGRLTTLFSDPCGVSLKIQPDGRLRLTRKKETLTGQKALPINRWTHLAALYDGEHLRLYIDGILDTECAAKPQVIRINSLPVIGNNDTFSEGFRGLLGGLHLQSGVLKPERFVLRSRHHD